MTAFLKIKLLHGLFEQEEHLQADSLLQQEEQQMCTKMEEQDTLNSTHTHTHTVEARP